MTLAKPDPVIPFAMSDLYTCETGLPGGTLVRTPFQLSNGHLVSLFIVERDGRYLVTDYGEADGFLFLSGGPEEYDESTLARINDLIRPLDVTRRRGQLEAWCDDPAQLPWSVHLVAQAVVLVASLELQWR